MGFSQRQGRGPWRLGWPAFDPGLTGVRKSGKMNFASTHFAKIEFGKISFGKGESAW
jgi:hypothetical protein